MSLAIGNLGIGLLTPVSDFVVANSETDLGNGFMGPDEVGAKETEYSGPFGSYMNQYAGQHAFGNEALTT